MTRYDFINYINETFSKNENYESLKNLIIYGISSCEDGEIFDELEPNFSDSFPHYNPITIDGKLKTVKCAYCKYYKTCDIIHELFND